MAIGQDVICKYVYLNIINKMYRRLQMDTDRDLGAKYPQEREGLRGGVQGGITHVY
jgi:hypothetical protein